MVQIFREVRRVLRDDGVVWLNLGDCFNSNASNQQSSGVGGCEEHVGMGRYNKVQKSMAAGNLMLMPHRVAIALQDDGWVVRNDCVWSKKNPMPESVSGWRFERSKKEKQRIVDGGMQTANIGSFTAQSGGRDKVVYEYGDDYVLRKGSFRHTRAHEYIFQLVKSMGYYSNQEAVRETSITGDGVEQGIANGKRFGGTANAQGLVSGFGERVLRNPLSGRNPRSVLDVPTAPYSGAHYATFPANLIAPLIRASCPRRSCPECGAPWAPVVEKDIAIERDTDKSNMTGQDNMQGWEGYERRSTLVTTVKSYRPTCSCGHEPVPGIVLDPFGGSGTTGMVAKQLMRRWFILDISHEYLDEQAKIRTGSGSPGNSLDDLPLFDNGDKV